MITRYVTNMPTLGLIRDNPIQHMINGFMCASSLFDKLPRQKAFPYRHYHEKRNIKRRIITKETYSLT